MPKRPMTTWRAALEVLFKEVLELIPEEDAQQMIYGYNHGRTLAVTLGQSRYGPDKMTAFQMRLTDEQSWPRHRRLST
jgi:hypothetical protein